MVVVPTLTVPVNVPEAVASVRVVVEKVSDTLEVAELVAVEMRMPPGVVVALKEPEPPPPVIVIVFGLLEVVTPEPESWKTEPVRPPILTDGL